VYLHRRMELEMRVVEFADMRERSWLQRET
jgi:hypothetical protein